MLTIFLFFNLIVSLSFSVALWHYGVSDLFLALIMLTPGLIALALSFFDTEHPTASMGWRLPLAGLGKIALFFLSTTVCILAIALFNGHITTNHVSLGKFLRYDTIIAVLVGVATGLGEEVGWRGYMFPKLYRKHGWYKSIGLSILIWWAWHVPMMAVIQIKMFGHVQWDTQGIQLIAMIPFTVIGSFWYFKYKSVWLIGIAHMLTNFCNKWFLGLEHSFRAPIFFADKSYCHLYSTENGIVGVGCLILIMLVYNFYFRRKLPTQ